MYIQTDDMSLADNNILTNNLGKLDTDIISINFRNFCTYTVSSAKDSFLKSTSEFSVIGLYNGL